MKAEYSKNVIYINSNPAMTDIDLVNETFKVLREWNIVDMAACEEHNDDEYYLTASFDCTISEMRDEYKAAKQEAIKNLANVAPIEKVEISVDVNPEFNNMVPIIKLGDITQYMTELALHDCEIIDGKLYGKLIGYMPRIKSKLIKDNAVKLIDCYTPLDPINIGGALAFERLIKSLIGLGDDLCNYMVFVYADIKTHGIKASYKRIEKFF